MEMSATKTMIVGGVSMVASNLAGFASRVGQVRLPELFAQVDLSSAAAGLTIVATAVAGAIAVVGGSMTKIRLERRKAIDAYELEHKKAFEEAMKGSLTAQIESLQAKLVEQSEEVKSNQGELMEQIEEANQRLHAAKNAHNEDRLRMDADRATLVEQNRLLLETARQQHESNEALRREIHVLRERILELERRLAKWETGEHATIQPPSPSA